MKPVESRTNIESQVQRALDCQPKANVEVLRFIYEFIEQRDRDGNSLSDAIIDKFVSGYCYYFALMLKDAFDGELMWVKGRGHIVYYDYQSKLCYDVYGVYVPDISQDGTGEPVPLESLGGSLEAFRHRGRDEELGDHIGDYCKATGITQEDLAKKVCNSFPLERRVFVEPNKGDLYNLWDEWYENNTNNLDNLCLLALKEGEVYVTFFSDEKLFDELAEQIGELVMCKSQEWLERHPKSTACTSNCGMLYYCELLDKYFRFAITRWTDVKYEVCVSLEECKSQKEQLQKLNQF